ncbi:MAG: hypothetical protein JXR05_05895 [Flavobacteriaceae bacterium]
MKIVQTFWSGNKKHLLQDSFGWHNSTYHVQSWALSCQLLRRLYSNVELYTDRAGHDLLIKKLKLPYTRVHIVLDELNHYPSSVWALSKIRTYSLQESPFIHIDGDVFLWKKFDERLSTSKLLVQNREIGNKYINSSWNAIENNLKFIPNDILRHRQKKHSVNVYNFGIFGGQDLGFIKEYSKKAFEFVDKNLERLKSINGFNFNIYFEQYLFYCMAQQQSITTYFEEDFIADQYKGFANFEEVTLSKNYLHLLGDFKKKEEVCKKMSRQLSVEFPEQYLKILEIYHPNDYLVFKNQLNTNLELNNVEIKKSFSTYYKAIPETSKFHRTHRLLLRHFSSLDKNIKNVLITENHIKEKVLYSKRPNLKSVFEYEQKIKDYLSNIHTLNFHEFSKEEYIQSKKYIAFSMDINSYFIRTNSIKRIFKWGHLIGDVSSDFNGENLHQEFSRLIIPSAQAPYYNEIILSELDKIILEKSGSHQVTFQKLLLKIENYFDKVEIKNNYEDYKNLILKTIKRLVYRKALVVEHI